MNFVDEVIEKEHHGEGIVRAQTTDQAAVAWGRIQKKSL
jgi:hypothetical protein